MNSQYLSEKEELINAAEVTTTELDQLAQDGFAAEEIVSLLGLRHWYQNGGSDRVEVLRHLEFLKHLVAQGKIEL